MENIAKILLTIEAVSLRPDKPFTWASGIQSPIYCDNRLILSYPRERKVVEAALAEAVRSKFPEVEMLMGTATAGIPHAALVADELELPMGFVRGKAKDHGKGNAIEGRIQEGIRVVVIEDLISTGGSSMDVVNTLKEAGCEVLGVVAIFTYGMAKARERFAKAQLPLVTLTDYDELLNVAVAQNYLKAEDEARLKQFMADPSSQDWMRR